MNISALRYYGNFYKGSYRLLVLSVFATIAQSFLLLAIPFLIRYIFDDAIPAGNPYLLGLIGAGIVCLYLLNGIIALYTRYVILKVTKVAIQRFREKILDKFYSLSRAYYSEADRSKLHTCVVQDTERLDVMSNALVTQLIPAIVISIALSAVLIFLNWFLFLVMLVIAPFLFVLSKSTWRMVKKRVHAYHRSVETFSKGMLFVLEMMDLTRIESAEELEIERQRKKFEELRLTSGSMAWLNAAYSVVHKTLIAASGIIVLTVGGISVSKGYMTIGELLSFYVAVALLKNYLSTISSCIPEIIEGNESLISLFNLLEIKDSKPYCGEETVSFEGKITLESVSFKYKDEPVLSEINLTINPRTTVALVGPNGAGKSTIINLILGFYRPQKGQLYADDYPFNELDIVKLRRHIGVVMQDPIIFPGTVFENISYGCRDASSEQVVRAAELATAHDFIQELPEGYDTFIGEKRGILSGGQHQRIAIARAFLRQPKLLILDEPTNHLDEASVERLMNNLEGMEKTPSILIISHDMDIIRRAQVIHLLREGCIVKSGDHEMFSSEEMSSSGVF